MRRSVGANGWFLGGVKVHVSYDGGEGDEDDVPGGEHELTGLGSGVLFWERKS